jgi:hypothetical protein
VQDDIEIIVYPGSEFTWYGMQDVIHACPYDSIILKPDPQPSDWEYLWSNGSVADHITVGSTGIGFNVNNYTLTTTSPNGCTFSDNIQVVFDFSYCFGVDENEDGNNVKIIPNPSKGKFRVEISEQRDFELLSVFNSFSVKVFERDIAGQRELEIDLGNLPEGLYFLALKGNTSLEFDKVLISR